MPEYPSAQATRKTRGTRVPITAVHWSSLFVDQAHVRAQNEPRFAPGEGQGAHADEVAGALLPRGNAIPAVMPAGVHPLRDWLARR